MTAKSPTAIVPQCLDWPSMVGNFILNFGTLEMLVIRALERHVAPEVFVRVRKLHLKDRLAALGESLSAAGLTRDECQAFDRLVEDLEPVRELRNVLAHGTLFVWWDPEREGAPIVTVARAIDLDGGWEPGNRRIEFVEVLNASQKLSEISEALEPLAGYEASQGVPRANGEAGSDDAGEGGTVTSRGSRFG